MRNQRRHLEAGFLLERRFAAQNALQGPVRADWFYTSEPAWSRVEPLASSFQQPRFVFDALPADEDAALMRDTICANDWRPRGNKQV